MRKRGTGTIQKNGYISIGNSKKRKYIHRIIMENFIGRELTINETVHHIDGNKLNNDIKNLEILTRSEHLRLHAIKNKLGKNRIGLSPINKTSKKIIKRIAVLRNKYKKSLNQICKITGLSYPTVQKYCKELKINKIGLNRWTNHYKINQ